MRQVNMATRLETLSKELDVTIIMSEGLKEELSPSIQERVPAPLPAKGSRPRRCPWMQSHDDGGDNGHGDDGQKGRDGAASSGLAEAPAVAKAVPEAALAVKEPPCGGAAMTAKKLSED